MFKKSGHAEIIRSHQKDEFYIGYLKSQITDISQALLGPRNWIKWRKELDLFADLGYFTLTTFAGFQTIGEEYVNIIQVDNTLRALPSRFRRIFLILIHVLTPYTLHKVIDWFEKWLKSPVLHDEIPAETKHFLLKCVPVIRQTVTFLHRCHLALFYFQGMFYHLAKRFAGVNYVKYSLHKQQTGPNFLTQSFKILGVLSFAQLVGSIGIHAYNAYINKDKIVKSFRRETTPDLDDSEVCSPALKCALCLEKRQSTTSTPCGHLFCWNCIHEWCQNKPECPLCREKLQPQSLVFLHNFDPPG
ncbi:peroxisome assembly protein 10-B-like [Mytilus trossulus]|uniref:peroxisome assembly protein 10-B-like n=1 Tax=Mytilus trossulus TaxID=6551 RepID=UPI003003DA27